MASVTVHNKRMRNRDGFYRIHPIAVSDGRNTLHLSSEDALRLAAEMIAAVKKLDEEES